MSFIGSITGNLFQAVAVVIKLGLDILMYLVIARAVLSWVSPDPYNPIVRFIHNTTDPILRPIRSKLPTTYGGMDFSPIIVIFAIYFLKIFIVGSLFDLSSYIR